MSKESIARQFVFKDLDRTVDQLKADLDASDQVIGISLDDRYIYEFADGSLIIIENNTFRIER